MLSLIRKEGESIHIGKDVRVIIISCSDKEVVVGIEAPKSIRIYRHEIWEKMKKMTLGI